WRQWRTLDRNSALMAAGAGVMLALHFWSWNASVSFTTVSASVVLVNTQPIIVGLLSVVWLREPPTRRQWIGIATAIVGGIVIALAVGPMLLGHTGLNWALKYLPAYAVNVTLLGEPIGATVLAAVLPGIHENPGPATLLGGALVLAGVLAASRRAER